MRLWSRTPLVRINGHAGHVIRARSSHANIKPCLSVVRTRVEIWNSATEPVEPPQLRVPGNGKKPPPPILWIRTSQNSDHPAQRYVCRVV